MGAQVRDSRLECEDLLQDGQRHGRHDVRRLPTYTGEDKQVRVSRWRVGRTFGEKWVRFLMLSSTSEAEHPSAPMLIPAGDLDSQVQG